MNRAILRSLAALGVAVSGITATAAGAPEAALIKTFQFQPKSIEVRAGTTITWRNQDNIEHTVTSGTPDAPGPDFDSGGFGKDRSFSATFDRPGEYAYFCARHKSMRGMVKVLPAE